MTLWYNVPFMETESYSQLLMQCLANRQSTVKYLKCHMDKRKWCVTARRAGSLLAATLEFRWRVTSSTDLLALYSRHFFGLSCLIDCWSLAYIFIIIIIYRDWPIVKQLMWNMKKEIAAVVFFLKRLIKKGEKLDSAQIEKVVERLVAGLQEKFRGHWYPENPSQGQAFR